MQNSIQKYFGHTQQKIPNSSKDFFQASLETIFALPKSNYRIPGGLVFQDFQDNFFAHPQQKIRGGGNFFLIPFRLGAYPKFCSHWDGETERQTNE